MDNKNQEDILQSSIIEHNYEKENVDNDKSDLICKYKWNVHINCHKSTGLVKKTKKVTAGTMTCN